jgi:hypothetical protein
MLENILSAGALTIAYAIILIVSFLFALLSLIGAEIGDLFDFGADVGSEGIFDLAAISPFALAMFGSTFGFVGLLTRLWLEMDSIPSILWSAGIGLVVGIIAQLLFIYVLSPSKSSHYSLTSDAIGREAEVIITIPDDGAGTIAFDNVSGRVTLGARSSSGRQIRTGKTVIIEKIIGRNAVVRVVDEETPA